MHCLEGRGPLAPLIFFVQDGRRRQNNLAPLCREATSTHGLCELDSLLLATGGRQCYPSDTLRLSSCGRQRLYPSLSRFAVGGHLQHHPEAASVSFGQRG